MNIKIDLEEKILTYIAYCLPKQSFRVRHEQLRQMIKATSRIDYAVATLRKELSTLKASGLVGSRRRYGKNVLTLTQEGRLRIAPHLSYKTFGHWDGRWRLVITNIPEADRKYRLSLFKKLSELGFRRFREGVFISPHSVLGPAKYLVTHYGLNRYVMMLETDEIVQEKNLVAHVWGLNDINDRYQHFVKTAKINHRADWPLKAKVYEKTFEAIYRDDPHLPSDLLPKDWHGQLAYERYKKITASY